MIIAALLSLVLYTETSLPGETRDDFVVRIAPRAVEHTAKLRSEVCGEIIMVDGVYSLTITTDNRPTACDITMSGQADTVTFHTHPARTDVRGFSDLDYKHPGYVAFEDRLRFQAGRLKDVSLSSRLRQAREKNQRR